ncbi:MAG: ankyrin repeat domain-containing protein [Pyrinomonadaceae bacterium]
MGSKSFLDSIEVPAPCDKSWDKMIGNDRKRFCLGCEKDVYNLSAMHRGEARRLVAKNVGKICVRYGRLPNGSVLTTERNLHQIARRTPAIAAGVIAATLSLSALTYAQGERVPTKSETKKAAKTRRSDYSKTSQISFTIYDQAGAVIAGAEVKLINQKTKKEYIILTNQDGVSQFNLLPAGGYDLRAIAPNFYTHSDKIQLKEPIEPNIEIMLRVGMVGDFTITSYEIPLFKAISQEDNETVKQLIISGFDVNKKDNDHRTALHVAVEHGNMEIVRFLLENGANVNIKTKEKLTPIWMIDDEETGTEIFQLLIEKGADVNVQNDQKETLLMLASENESVEAVKFLLQAGANLNLKDDDGETALQKAGSEEIRRLLINAGAREN